MYVLKDKTYDLVVTGLNCLHSLGEQLMAFYTGFEDHQAMGGEDG